MSSLADRIRGVLQTPGQKGPGLHQLEVREPATPEPVVSGFSRTDPGNNLKSVLGGEWRRHDSASCFVVETRREPSSAYGGETVGVLASRFAEAAAGASLVAGSPASSPFVFFDLETTGLSGGAGTYAFLFGCGSFEDDGAFVTRQYLLVRFDDERALLASVGRELARAGALVSFNGKSFDAPVLETRYLYHRLEWMGGGLPHLDMLPVARRFWKRDDVAAAGESSCSLVALEQKLLGARRQGDVPGFEIPSRYFHFVRTGDARPLRAVFEHNRRDLLSLAALTARALHLVRSGPEATGDPREALALGHVYDRAGLAVRARDAYLRAVSLTGASTAQAGAATLHGASMAFTDTSMVLSDASMASLRIAALRALALASRRSRAYGEAAGYWRQILDVRGCPSHVGCEASEALAIHHEHRVRDLAAAKAFALRSLESGTHWNEAVRYRLARIERKMSASDRGALLD